MLQSNQINNENALPPIKISPLNSQGKVRVLSFDVNFSSKETAVKEDILLVKLPKNNAKIIQIGLTSAETTVQGEDEEGKPITIQGKFDIINSNIVYSSVNGSYTLVKDTPIKTDVPFTSTGSLVLNVNGSAGVPTAINSDNYIKIQASIPFTKDNIINGYVLYIVD